ncbi:unnamed protein product [Cuscuta campestris]|uniref:Uncharacterized protein n=1 Tax=Cuscuta campestris TaxID=132261 RepID=A0A484L2W3_9ASTE|nr:unnamed protein product [Cuscuta campestris]
MLLPQESFTTTTRSVINAVIAAHALTVRPIKTATRFVINAAITAHTRTADAAPFKWGEDDGACCQLILSRRHEFVVFTMDRHHSTSFLNERSVQPPVVEQ